MGTDDTQGHRGRPREFDVDEALDCALKVFWQNGYEGTSLTDLTEAMGITRPSLYAAFGSKEGLFRKVLTRYASGPAAFVTEALSATTAREVASMLLRGSVDMLTCPDNPSGCLMVQGALSSGEDAKPIRVELASWRVMREEAMRRRFDRALEEGDLPADSDPVVLARFISTVMQGMAVEAAAGARRDDLLRVVEMSMKSWPSA